MSEKTRSQAQQTFEAFQPIQAFGREQLDRMNAAFEEWKKLEAQGVERAKAAIDELSSLMKSSFGYALQMTEQWRQAAVEAGRNVVEPGPFRG